jgi:hypothetical protein
MRKLCGTPVSSGSRVRRWCRQAASISGTQAPVEGVRTSIRKPVSSLDSSLQVSTTPVAEVVAR